MSRTSVQKENRNALLEDPSQYESSVYPTSTSINGEVPATGCCAMIMQRMFKGDIKVALYALGLLCFSTGNSIFFKKMSDKMGNYPLFLSQLTTFVYLPIFFGIVWWEMRYTDYITPEMRAFPKRKFLFMGLFDALSGICMLFGGLHTSGSFQALLLNAVIPFTMGLSIVFLSTKYLRTQYAGACIIMAGVAVVIVPNIVSGSSSDNNILFNIIFLLSTLPQAFSSIYKEIAFGDVDLDVNYLQAWVALFQVILGLLLAPLNALPFLQDAYVPFLDIPRNIADGARCFAGISTTINSTIVEADGSKHGSCWTDQNEKWGAPADTKCDQCSGAWLPTTIYIMFNCFYNLFIVLVIKHGNAALLWIILTLRLPLVQIAFALKFIYNPPDEFKITSIIGLFVILAGLVLYRWSSVAAAAKDPEAEQDEEAIVDPGLAGSDSFNQRLTHASAE